MLLHLTGKEQDLGHLLKDHKVGEEGSFYTIRASLSEILHRIKDAFQCMVAFHMVAT